MVMNQTCYGIRGAGCYSHLLTYWSVRTAVDELQTRTHRTIFDTINHQTFELVETVLVPVEVAQTFESVVGLLMTHILENLHGSRVLVIQRDALLPRMMSDQLTPIGSKGNER